MVDRVYKLLEERHHVMDVKGYDANLKMRLWVGMAKSEDKFTWLSDSTFPGLWGEYQPKNMSFVKCVTLVKDGLNDAICYSAQRYICQIQLKDKDRTEPSQKGGSCPIFKKYHKLSSKLCIRLSSKNENLNWGESRDACKRDGGDLASFYNETEQDKVLTYLNDMGYDAYDKAYRMLRVWIGMSKVTGEFKWVSRSSFYGQWGIFQPQDKSFLKCVLLKMDGLYDSVCGVVQRYLCRLPSTE